MAREIPKAYEPREIEQRWAKRWAEENLFRADVNAPGLDGLTPLHLAAQANDAAMAQLLLGAGANPNAVDRYGTTPLHLAATNGSAAMIEASPLTLASHNGVEPSRFAALAFAPARIRRSTISLSDRKTAQ